MPHTATRVRDVTVPARDDVHVQVRDGLARGGAGVEAHIPAVGGRRQLALEQSLHLCDQVEDRALFFKRDLEPRGDHAPRNHEGVPTGHREAIRDGKRQIVAGHPGRPRNRQEWALPACHSFSIPMYCSFRRPSSQGPSLT